MLVSGESRSGPALVESTVAWGLQLPNAPDKNDEDNTDNVIPAFVSFVCTLDPDQNVVEYVVLVK